MSNAPPSSTSMAEPASLPELESLADFCSLSSAALDDRRAWIRSEIEPHACAKQKLENGLAWDFDATPDMRTKLDELARLERDCCSGLEFEVWENSSRTHLRFEILGTDPNSGFFDGLSLAAPSGEAKAASSIRWGTLAKRGGFAAAASLVICCVIPVGLVSLAGLTIAAPLLALDNPWTIGAGTLVIGATLWVIEKRHASQVASLKAASMPNKGVGCGC